MKVLSIMQPWASLVVMGQKRIETRSWNTKYRGPLLIHASLKKVKVFEGLYDLLYQLQAIPGFMENYDKLPYGVIVGKVDLIETICMTTDKVGADAIIDSARWVLTEKEYAFGDYREDRYGWLLANAKAFETPIPAKGKLGLWSFDVTQHGI
jgi:hypothetical protein